MSKQEEPDRRIKPNGSVSENMRKAIFEFPKRNLIEYALMVKAWLEALEAVGEIEHTNDWDLYLEIELHTGEVLETPSGYAWIDSVNSRSIYFAAPDNPDEGEPINKFFREDLSQYKIPQNEIHKITIQR